MLSFLSVNWKVGNMFETVKDKVEFVATHCYLCSCIDCPQTEDALLNCYKKVVKNEQTQEKET